jgi:ComF family protein
MPVIRTSRWLMTVAAKSSVRAVLDTVYPPICVSCETSMEKVRDGILLCKNCRDELAMIGEPSCRRCGAPTPAGSPAMDDCPLCRDQGFHFDHAVALGRYEGLLRRLILETKDPAGEPVAMTLARLTIVEQRSRLAHWQPDVVVATPMHWRRRLVRRTNAAELIAGEVARSLGVPSAPRLLRRRRNTPPQFSLSRSDRLQNVRGAFVRRMGYSLKAAHVLLVDDILTTGATCSEAARVLKQSGAARVAVLALARTVGSQ